MTSAKAIIGGIISALLAGMASLATVLVGNDTLHNVTAGQWLAVAIAVLATGGSVFGSVYVVSNNPTPKISVETNGVHNITTLPSVNVPVSKLENQGVAPIS